MANPLAPENFTSTGLELNVGAVVLGPIDTLSMFRPAAVVALHVMRTLLPEVDRNESGMCCRMLSFSKPDAISLARVRENVEEKENDLFLRLTIRLGFSIIAQTGSER